VKELFDVLLNERQKVVIPAFSIQRTQDILLLLLRYYEEVVIPQREELKK
jgi:Cft2 family RNA processing exonuclease